MMNNEPPINSSQSDPQASDATRLEAASAGAPPHRHGRAGRLRPDENARITRRITALAVILGLIMAVGKFFIWQESDSVGIFSSLMHSALDLFGAFSTFFAVRYAARSPDKTYRFGRGKAESFSAVFQVCLIIFAAFHIIEEAIERLSEPQIPSQPTLALGAITLFIGLTLWLLIAQSRAIRATASVAIKGDRAHYLADLLTNIIVIAGIIFSTYTPFIHADAIAALCIGLWLFFTAYQVAFQAWSQLLDRELPDTERALIKTLALEDPQVKSIHDLRTRASGPHIHIQMRLEVDENLSLMAAHDIVIHAEKRIMHAFQAADILIHPHPENCHHTHGNIRFRSKDST